MISLMIQRYYKASGCDGDEEFLLFLLITSKERENHIRIIRGYFERIVPLYSLSDF